MAFPIRSLIYIHCVDDTTSIILQLSCCSAATLTLCRLEHRLPSTGARAWQWLAKMPWVKLSDVCSRYGRYYYTLLGWSLFFGRLQTTYGLHQIARHSVRYDITVVGSSFIANTRFSVPVYGSGTLLLIEPTCWLGVDATFWGCGLHTASSAAVLLGIVHI